MWLIDVEEKSAKTRARNAEKEPETEENGGVEEKSELSRIDVQGEEGGDQRESDEIARTYR